MQVNIYHSLVFAFCLILCWTSDPVAQPLSDSSTQVWQVGSRRWSVAEEQRFATWVEETITEDFFIRYDIPVDCADVPYAIRWIYSRIFHLPAAATMSDGRLFGHWSTAWKHLPTNHDWFRDRRFRTALLYMLAETSTRTLPADTYPISITRESVLAGSVFIGEGHAGIVGRIVLDGSMYSPVQTWEATLPRKVTKLRQGSYFSAWPDISAGNGLVRFSWPIFTGNRWLYLLKQEHPFYSLEQYSPGFWHTGELFDEIVAQRIDPKEYDPTVRARLILDSIYGYLLSRIPLIKEGYRHCGQSNCPEGSHLYEIYSTPSRDDMIAFEIEHFLKIMKDNKLNEKVIERIMEERTLSIDDRQTVSLKDIVQNYLWLSPDPGDSIEARWGLRKCGMIQARIRGTLRTLDFVEQQYRASDPEYADYGRSRHLTNLKQLQNEGKRTGCNNLSSLSSESLQPSIANIPLPIRGWLQEH